MSKKEFFPNVVKDKFGIEHNINKIFSIEIKLITYKKFLGIKYNYKESKRLFHKYYNFSSVLQAYFELSNKDDMFEYSIVKLSYDENGCKIKERY